MDISEIYCLNLSFLCKMINKDMLRADKFRLYPTKEQEEILVEWIGCARFVWNKYLETNKAQYEKDKTFIWAFDFMKQLPELKKEHLWLKACPAQALQQVCGDMEKALRMTSKKRTKRRFGFPHFRHKRKDGSIRIPQQVGQIKAHKDTVHLPKIGEIKWKRHRPIQGKIKNVTIKQENGKWFACVCQELPDVIQEPRTPDVGIDFGLKTFLVLSDGTTYENQNFYRNDEEKIAELNRSLSRKKKGSKRRQKARARLVRAHNKIRNRRKDYLHKTSRKIANSYKGVVIEDLSLEQMKSRFGKSVSDQGYNQFISYLSYKTQVTKVDRYFPSSQLCSKCGTKNPEMKSLTKRVFKCESCGHEMDRDLNAAINIYTEGTSGCARSATGGVDIGTDIDRVIALKREKFFDDLGSNIPDDDAKKPAVL